MKQREPTGLNKAGVPEQRQLQKAIASTLNTVRGDAIRHKAINFAVIRQKSRHAVSNENNNKKPFFLISYLDLSLLYILNPFYTYHFLT